MKLPISWLREFVNPDADVREVAEKLGACGFAVDGIESGVLDVDVTANRPDGLNVIGLAREVATAFGVPLTITPAQDDRASSTPAGPVGDATMPVTIESPACGRYALVLVDVTIAPSPAWLTNRLLSAGVRPINNVVDVSNYVMLECGQPTHAFDAAKLAGSEIRVRLARPGETLTTLDGQRRVLDDAMLVIADRDRASAIAGVMGGMASEVSSTTTRVALESAWFAPASVRITARRLGLKTEASARFERGADIDMSALALARALALLAQIGAGRAAGPVVDVFPAAAAPRVITLRRSRISLLLGDTVPDNDVARVLTSLGFSLATTADGWTVTVPSFRVDVTREVDVIEDVGRHWGFDRIPSTFPALRTVPRVSAPAIRRIRRLRRVLTGAGIQEACTFTFIDRAAAVPFVADEAALVAIANPLSEKFAVMRPSLLPGLVDSLIHSRRRETVDVRLFETGSIFRPDGERQRAAWVLTGPWAEHWSGAARGADFFDAKGLADLIGSAFGIAMRAHAATDVAWLVRGRAARLSIGDAPIGVVGQLRPDIAAARGLGAADAVYAGEIDLDALFAHARDVVTRVEPLPRYPSVTRDLSIIVSARLPASDVRGTIHAHAPATLVRVREFDRYQGTGVPEGQVSLSWRLTFRSAERTLTDADVQHAVATIVAALAAAHGAALRGATTT